MITSFLSWLLIPRFVQGVPLLFPDQLLLSTYADRAKIIGHPVCKYDVISEVSTGACRGLVFGGGMTPHLAAPGVTPDLNAPPKILTAPPEILTAPTYFWMLLFHTNVYLVNHYFLTAPGRFLTAPR